MKGGTVLEETISLQEILDVLKKRMKMIAVVTISFMLVAAIISFFFMTPIYQATSQVLVNQQKNMQNQQITTSEIQSNVQLINTYQVIIKSPAILNIVIDNLNLDMSPSQLASKITVNAANNSQVFNVSVQDPSNKQAVDLVNEIVTVFKQEMPKLMSVDNVNILAPAQKSEAASPIKPNKKLNIAIGTILGLMVGVGLAFLQQYLDKTVKTEKDVEELLQLPVLGLIGKIPDKVDVGLEKTQRRRSSSTAASMKGGL